MKVLLLYILVTFSVCRLAAQDSALEKEAAYTKTITTRAEKIVSTLDITDKEKAQRVTNIISNHYRNLNAVYTERDNRVKQIKEKGLEKESESTLVKSEEEAVSKKIGAIHNEFITCLSKDLSPEQIVKVKDGLTYNVVNVTYTAMLDMIPSLTPVQKEKIYNWLVEAREFAMDAESSEKKHWWFGKYKGKINNYLAAEGYDLKKEREEWEKRKKSANPNIN